MKHIRKWVVISLTAMLVFVVGVAVALQLFKADVGGSVTVVGAGAEFVWLDVSGTGACSSSSVVGVDDEAMNIVMSNASPGEACRIDATFFLESGPSGLVVQDIVFSSEVDVFFDDNGGGCGAPLVDEGDGGTDITFYVIAPTETGTFLASSGSGLFVVDAPSYDSQACSEGPDPTL